MQNNNKPVVSIIIPTLNRGKIIHETLESIANQSYKYWECIVVDDGSTDGTIRVIDKFRKKDGRFKLERRNNFLQGANTCRNIGIKLSRGKYIVFIDSDDLFSHEALEDRARFMEKNIDLECAVFPCLRFKYTPYDQNILLSSYRGANVIPLFLKKDIPWGTLNVIYQRKSLLQNNIFWEPKIRVHQDIEFHIKTICRGLRFAFADTEPDCFWREHGTKNPNHNMDFKKNIQSNIYLLNSLVNELTRSNNFSKDNRVILSRMFLIETLKDAIFFDDYEIFIKIVNELYRLKVISSFINKCSVFASTLSPGKNRNTTAKILKHILIKIYGTNEIKYFLKEPYENT